MGGCGAAAAGVAAANAAPSSPPRTLFPAGGGLVGGGGGGAGWCAGKRVALRAADVLQLGGVEACPGGGGQRQRRRLARRRGGRQLGGSAVVPPALGLAAAGLRPPTMSAVLAAQRAYRRRPSLGGRSGRPARHPHVGQGGRDRRRALPGPPRVCALSNPNTPKALTRVRGGGTRALVRARTDTPFFALRRAAREGDRARLGQRARGDDRAGDGRGQPAASPQPEAEDE